MRELRPKMPREPGPREQESLSGAIDHVINEARMILPGAQVFVGFQLIAPFNQRFKELAPDLQWLHVGTTGLGIVALVLLMTPAVYHRQAEREWISGGFLNLASRVLAWGTTFLGAAFVLELYVVSVLALQDRAVALAVAAVVGGALVTAWFLLPYFRPLRETLRR